MHYLSTYHPYFRKKNTNTTKFLVIITTEMTKIKAT